MCCRHQAVSAAAFHGLRLQQKALDLAQVSACADYCIASPVQAAASVHAGNRPVLAAIEEPETQPEAAQEPAVRPAAKPISQWAAVEDIGQLLKMSAKI